MPKKTSQHEDPVEVPEAYDMENETFLKHIEHRHAAECKVEGFLHRNAQAAWVPTYRAFHQRLHDIATPGQYDHVHVDEDEEDEDD